LLPCYWGEAVSRSRRIHEIRTFVRTPTFVIRTELQARRLATIPLLRGLLLR
jgi:hypothetical protein